MMWVRKCLMVIQRLWCCL